MKNVLITCLLLFIKLFLVFGEDYSYLREISFNDFKELNDPEIMVRALIIKFEKTDEGIGSGPDPYYWDIEVQKQGRDLIPGLMTIVTENEIKPHEFDALVGYELYLVLHILLDLHNSGSLTFDERKWFSKQYKDKLSRYLLDYRELTIVIANYDYYIDFLETDQKFEPHIYGSNSKDRMKYIFKKYSDKGYMNLYISSDFYKFDDYDELVEKYKSVNIMK